ncbi:MAG: radical SAM protein [Candidatus Adiutrix sp.]|jgi:radical SAM protein with 4Fe4S-binding SPASM domain|nr:radical SAM protein [Candidatus Adiutrix sp.]
MIGISKLYCGTAEPSDVLRYGRQSGKLPSRLLQFSEDKKPVVVWNMTKACNLTCAHCYASAAGGPAQDELNLAEAEKLVDHLAEYGAPVILFSGGEPLLHPHLTHLVRRAVSRGCRAVVSTNGMLLSEERSKRLFDAGAAYIGISLDGLSGTHDRFRRCEGAFVTVMNSIETARKTGLKVGLRLTMTRANLAELPDIFCLLEKENLPRICFYHLVNAGRGQDLEAMVPDHDETRRALDLIISETKRLHDQGLKIEALTVDNHADGPYLYLKMKAEGRRIEAEKVMSLLKLNGGNNSGKAIAAISWNGDVHPDQFWRTKKLGSIRNRDFAEIWHDKTNKFLMALKNKKDYVEGRCRSCAFLDVCGGGLRARAEEAGSLWGPDPACYLSDAEIGLEIGQIAPDKGALNGPVYVGQD